MKTILQIEGMSCEHCVKAVTEALHGIDGIKKAKVNLKKKTAIVDHGETVGLDAMKAAVTEAGFTVGQT
ncbi:MAG: copper ion binding protein [Termitinemataceae bacterium]|nr:MAG: copper ion binding protein [Termitinemataceae bacterium]